MEWTLTNFMATTLSAVAGALRTGAAPTVRRVPFTVALTTSLLVGGSSCPASLWAYLIAATRRPMLAGLMPRAASAARKAATVSGVAGIAGRCRSAHHAV